MERQYLSITIIRWIVNLISKLDGEKGRIILQRVISMIEFTR